MTFQFDINALVLGAADALGICWVKLKDLGVLHSALVVMGTGDGLATFENTGDTAGPFDVLSGGATSWPDAGANTFSHTESWMRLREAGSTREFLIQRNNSSSSGVEDDVTIQFSPTGFDNTGVASATVAPTASAADEVFVCGTAVGVEAQWGPATALDTRVHVAIEDTAQGGVFSFYIVCRLASNGTANGVFIYESLVDGIVGDLQPWIIHCPTGSGSGNCEFANLDGLIGTYVDFGGGSEVFLPVRGTTGASLYGLRDFGGGTLIPGAIPPQVDGDARTFPIVVGRNVISDYRGICRNLRWKGTDARDYPDTVNLATVNAQVYFDDVLFPWEQTTVPLT